MKVIYLAAIGVWLAYNATDSKFIGAYDSAMDIPNYSAGVAL